MLSVETHLGDFEFACVGNFYPEIANFNVHPEMW